MARLDPQVAAHLEWIGFVKPTGLVVSAPTLVRAGVILNRRDIQGQNLLNDWADSHQHPPAVPPQRFESPQEAFCSFARQVLEWSFSPKGYAGTAEAPIPAELEAQILESGDVSSPDFAVRAAPLTTTASSAASPELATVVADGSNGAGSRWQLLVSITDAGTGFDRAGRTGLELSAHSRMERLLRHTGAPAGLLFNGDTLRLISAPSGESSGWVDFQIADMRQTAGRPICAAMRELLHQNRLLSVPTDRRLAALLRDSRKFQNEVSERLAQQVLHALYELLRGFQAAHDATRGELLERQLKDDPDEIYRGLLTVVLRLVFLLYAEERDMLPQDEVFLSAYSVTGLYGRLREDAALHPDTMDQRYGAYAQLLALWRMVHDGAQGPGIGLSPRHGDLFDPDRYPFLEGRTQTGPARLSHQRVNAPLISDGTIHRVLEKLVVLNAERISYRALDVEHIGSVYETMMGFRLETATGPSVAIKAAKKHGAPATINIEDLLQQTPSDRARWLRDRTDRKLTPNVSNAVRQISADTGAIDDMHAALDAVIDKNATPDLMPTGAMVLQPSEERRRSGSHYTPRELTEPIVRTALEPVLTRLQTEQDGPLRPDQILDLKVCDPAMGSGAFLVEACRQLSEALIEAWRAHDITPAIPLDEDETIFARRLVAQRCLYGVDRNPKAVDLAKLSLWLTTLAKEHPLTFLDHALRHGDSLIGLSVRQLRAFHWEADAPNFAPGFEALKGRDHLDTAAELRELIREADDTVSDAELRDLWDAARSGLTAVRLLGDLAVAAFFEGTNPKDRRTRQKALAAEVLNGNAETHRQRLDDLRDADPPLAPFHWQIEFPEVFDRHNPGFDVIVGNPPFAGKNTLANSNVDFYRDWLKHAHPDSHGSADLVAHFFRRAFDLIRLGGSLGLIATNTIAQGDTRTTGLRWICTNGGHIYHARRRFSWPGVAAVVVSIVHIAKGNHSGVKSLDGRECDKITAFLFHDGAHDDPAQLRVNAGKSYQGSIVLGMGFTFDDSDRKEVASPLSRMHELMDEDDRNEEVIFPYIGGEEVNGDPAHSHHRYVINFRDYPLARQDFGEDWRTADENRRREMCREPIVPLDYPDPVAADWPELLAIVRDEVQPSRAKLTKNAIGLRRAKFWWQYGSTAKEFYAAIEGLDRVLAISRHTQHVALTFLPSSMTFAESLVVFPLAGFAAFCGLQSRVHEAWARFFGSSLEERFRYTPSDCFETFPFPEGWETLPRLDAAGEAYYPFRANLMVENNEGMTRTYNRFHDPDERDDGILKLRELHVAMDRAVLDAYGWPDIPTECDFILDYEIDEETWGNKKKPYRYRWPDEVRDDVLGRLLKLNAERAAEEARASQTDPKRRSRGQLRLAASQSSQSSISLFDSIT